MKNTVGKRGRPKTDTEIRELVVKLARKNEWGLDPGPKRGEGTWHEFLTQHAKTLWQCDFYAKKSLTLKDFRDLYVLVFLHVETRQVWITPG